MFEEFADRFMIMKAFNLHQYQQKQLQQQQHSPSCFSAPPSFQVPILPVACNGATLIASGRVPGILNAWTTDEFQPLLAAGINADAIEATWVIVSSSLLMDG